MVRISGLTAAMPGTSRSIASASSIFKVPALPYPVRMPLDVVLPDADGRVLCQEFGVARTSVREALRMLAATLLANVRAEDVACRYGGEEFLLLLTGVTAHEAFALVEGLREHFALTPMLTSSGALHIQFSAGLASWPVHGDALDELMRVADAALYQAKREGRNRILLAGSARNSAPHQDATGKGSGCGEGQRAAYW